MPTMTAAVVNLAEARCVRDIMEDALRDGIPAAEIRMAISGAIAAGDTLHDRCPSYDWDVFEAECRRLWDLGAIDRADFELTELH
jgi:hypothetical protein